MPQPSNSKAKTEQKKAPQIGAPWMVVIHDDPVNIMEYVTKVLQKVLGYNFAKAQNLMLQVHKNGRAIAWSGGKEKAEFYIQQLHTYQIHASLESL